jgi:hypothetical protein
MSVGKGQSSQQSTTDVWGPQAPYLKQLYEQAAGNMPGAGTPGFAGPARGAWEQMINPQANPYLENMGEAGLGQINRNLTQNVLPAIGNEAMGGMNLGSSRHGVAEGLATQGAQIAGGDFLTNLYGNQYQGDQNRALTALLNTGRVQDIDWNALNNFARLIGSPTKVGQSSGDSKSMSVGI